MRLTPCHKRTTISYEKEKTLNSQYDLKQSIFDPSKSSPPNSFIEKLRLRMSVYESFDKKVSILTNE